MFLVPPRCVHRDNNYVLSVNYNLIQIIKWMPPYWYNKALPTPTLTLPDTLFSTFWLFPLRCDMRFEKGEKKVWQKASSNQGRSRQKHYGMRFTTAPLKLRTHSRFLNVDYPNHTLVGGVRVNSLCQQGGLFALSVNRHSEYIIL